jgi:anti-anti-sigma factor
VNIQTNPDAGGVVHVSVAGEIDMATAEDLKAALHNAITYPGATRILVDFAQVSFCDSSGLHVLDQAYGDATTKSVSFQLVNLQPAIRRVLELVGVLDTLIEP